MAAAALRVESTSSIPASGPAATHGHELGNFPRSPNPRTRRAIPYVRAAGSEQRCAGTASASGSNDRAIRRARSRSAPGEPSRVHGEIRSTARCSGRRRRKARTSSPSTRRSSTRHGRPGLQRDRVLRGQHCEPRGADASSRAPSLPRSGRSGTRADPRPACRFPRHGAARTDKRGTEAGEAGGCPGAPPERWGPARSRRARSTPPTTATRRAAGAGRIAGAPFPFALGEGFLRRSGPDPRSSPPPERPPLNDRAPGRPNDACACGLFAARKPSFLRSARTERAAAAAARRRRG